MALAAGSHLGPYEITAQIGGGGRGEVYKARNARLDRTVAMKIVSTLITSAPGLQQRFEREAKILAALTHPHICQVFDVGSQDGVDFLVMEYLEGKTLAQRLAKGALPIDGAFQVAIQVANALAAAHRARDRDLKPGNIVMTNAVAELLDFGLAKSSASAITSGLSTLPTAPGAVTAQGTILGTFPYMAPEQIEGREADSRTDIFAFGRPLARNGDRALRAIDAGAASRQRSARQSCE